MKLTINICTRGRAHLIPETIETTLRNIALPQTILMVSCDEDDGASIETAFRYVDRCAVSVRPREDSVGAKFNRALTEAPADCYLFQADYSAILTPGFDRRILDAAAMFPDGIGCVYGPLVNLSFPAVQVITAGLADKLGYLYPEWFPYWFIDHWIDDVAHGIGRIVYAEVQVEPPRRKPGTTGMRDVAFWADFYDACQGKRRAEVESIVNALADPAWRKRVLLENLPMIDRRSVMLNNYVRSQAKAWEAAALADAVRYRRIKKRAEDELQAMRAA